jgi:hypothetical protein
MEIAIEHLGHGWVFPFVAILPRRFFHDKVSDGSWSVGRNGMNGHGAMNAPHNFIFYMKRSSPHASGVFGLWRHLGLGFVGL